MFMWNKNVCFLDFFRIKCRLYFSIQYFFYTVSIQCWSYCIMFFINQAMTRMLHKGAWVATLLGFQDYKKVKLPCTVWLPTALKGLNWSVGFPETWLCSHTRSDIASQALNNAFFLLFHDVRKRRHIQNFSILVLGTFEFDRQGV